MFKGGAEMQSPFHKSLYSNSFQFGFGAWKVVLAPWFLELVLLFLPLVLVELALPGPARLAAMNPHPFWIPVLLLSTQHGLAAGLSAAAAATVIASILGWPTQGGGEDLYDYSNRVWREPIMWIGAAIVLGCLRVQQIDKVAVLRNQFLNANVQRQDVAEQYERIRLHVEGLERQIASGEDNSLASAFSKLEQLATADQDQLGPALAAAVAHWVGPAVISVLLRRDDKLIDHPGFGMTSSPCPVSNELEAALMRGKRVLSLLRAEDAASLNNAALFAAPVFAIGSDKVVGALLLRSVDPMRIDGNLEVVLSVIAGALAHQIGKQPVVINFERDRLANRGGSAEDHAHRNAGRGAELMDLPAPATRVAS